MLIETRDISLNCKKGCYIRLTNLQILLSSCRFLKSPAAEEVCEYLTEVLGTSPLLLKELDLSGDILGALDGGKLSALLMDSHSKVETIK